MERQADDRLKKRNWIITGAAIAFAALAIAICFLLRPKAGTAYSFVIRYGDGKTLTVPAWETRTIVIRDGAVVNAATGEGAENVIHIENGEAWMEQANCPHLQCTKQGRLNGDTAKTRPLGTWIICAPHRVYIELAGDGQ